MSVWDDLQAGRNAGDVRRRLQAGAGTHAWLLLGPRGSGKRDVALAMAAALNCERSPGLGCGECSACKRSLGLRHPDVHLIAPEGPIIPVDVVREVITPQVALSPFEAATKVFVIEEAERMHPAAQNALLKTLEEPPRDTVFVLLCDQDDELLETIRSRCSAIRLQAAPEASIAAAVAGAGNQDRDVAVIARLSEGDLSLATRLARDTSAWERRLLFLGLPARLRTPVDALDAAAEVTAAAAAAVEERAATQRQAAAELADALGEARGTTAARTAQGARHKRELRRLESDVLIEALRGLGSFYRDVLALRKGVGQALLNLDREPELEAWARSPLPDAALAAAAHRCAVTPEALARNANPTLAVEAALVELSRLVPPPESVPV